MSFGLPRPIPATIGNDEVLIIGIAGLEAICIDQDGDFRLLTLTDLKTKWRYVDPGVWLSDQIELEDLLEEEEPAQ